MLLARNMNRAYGALPTQMNDSTNDKIRFFDCDMWTGTSDRFPTGGLNSPDALVAEMCRTGIDRALVYHIAARVDPLGPGNERLLEEIADQPRLMPAWVISPRELTSNGAASAFVEAAHAAGVRAVRMFPGEHGYRVTDTDCRPLLEALEQAGLVLILDAKADRTSMRTEYDYEGLSNVCQHHPRLPVILTQLHPTMGQFSEAARIVSAVQRVSNLHVDSARLQVVAGLRRFVDACGADRVVFGSHLPEVSAGAGIAAVLLSELTESEQRQVAGANLARILGENEDAIATPTPAPASDQLVLSQPYGFVDMHGHLRENIEPTDEYPDADQIVAEMDRTGITLCWISSIWTGPSGNDLVAEAVKRYPDRLVPYASADPRDPHITRELTRCFDQLGMKAIKIHPVQHHTPADDPSYEPVWRFANERHCLVVTHARCFDAERDAFIQIAREHPNMTFMLYHAGRTWEAVDNFVAAARQCPNVLLEITFSNNLDGIIEYLIAQVGVERVFFGTDIGVRAAESQVGWALGARLDEDVRRTFMRDNALALLQRMGALPQACEHPTESITATD